MAIAQVLASSQNGSGTTVTLTGIDVGAGSNRLLVVQANDQGSGASAITGMTYGGVTMTNDVVAVQFGPAAGGNNYLSTWTLANPPSGSNSLVISQSSSVSVFVDYYAMTGAAQSSYVDTTASLQGDSATGTHNQAVTTVTDGCAVISTCANQTNTNVYTSGNKVIDNGGMATAITSPFPQSPAGLVTFTWTITGATSGTRWAAQTIAIKPAGAAPGATLPFRSLQGVGI